MIIKNCDNYWINYIVLYKNEITCMTIQYVFIHEANIIITCNRKLDCQYNLINNCWTKNISENVYIILLQCLYTGLIY